MAFIDLGKLKFNWQGTWNSGTAYETDDVVFHGSQTFVATADVAAGQAEPQANTSWSLMAAGFNYRGTYAGGTTYYLHDVVTYGSALYMLEGIAETGSQTGVDPGSNPGSDNWEQLTPAPAANVMHQPGDMVFRNNANENARLPVNETVGLALNVNESPKETYSSRQFTYTLNGTNGNVINTAGSIAAVTYNIAVKAQRSTNYVIDGSDRDGDINWEYDGIIRVNIGDTVVFDTSAIHPSHPLAIRVSNGGASVSTGTYTGEGTTTVTWVTTGVTAGTYYYQCTSHPGMIGQIIVESTENRQGSAGANGTMEVCRGKTYTITLDGLTSGLNYNLFNAAAPQAGVTNAITSGEGNSAPGGTAYSGSAVTFTFTPNETTPDTVYLSSASNTSDQVAITVNDLAYVPGWATPQADDSLVLDDSDASNSFTIATGNQSANLTWTLPTAAPTANNQIIQFATNGTISYTDQPSGWYNGHATLRYNVGSNNTTTGGSLTAGVWTARNLNEIFENDGAVVSGLSGNQFTISAQPQITKYLIQWDGNVAYVNASQTRLFNVTNFLTEGMGGVSYASSSYWMDVRGCQGWCDITIPANLSRTFRIENIVQTTYATYGQGAGSGGTARAWGDGIHMFVNIWRYAN